MAWRWTSLPTLCNSLELLIVRRVRIDRVVMAGLVSRRQLRLATSVNVLRATQDSTVSSLEPAACLVIVTSFSMRLVSCTAETNS